MGKQSNKVENRSRRKRYLKRKKKAAKVKKTAPEKASSRVPKDANFQAA